LESNYSLGKQLQPDRSILRKFGSKFERRPDGSARKTQRRGNLAALRRHTQQVIVPCSAMAAQSYWTGSDACCEQARQCAQRFGPVAA
jgi:hypothetical protein